MVWNHHEKTPFKGSNLIIRPTRTNMKTERLIFVIEIQLVSIQRRDDRGVVAVCVYTVVCVRCVNA